ncbi:hypothetical protein WMO24_00355 [Ruthenibacterium sp. CLA-JM-H11]|uniref:Peptidase S54 rhomboid domain-containing protein n=1 Tax=Ruthenibacterium intestinale TaxID=3133163 RepID=A0ABV1GAN7_9FIRM
MFMKWVYRLERKHGNFCIHNLMMVIVMGQLLVYLADQLTPAIALSNRLMLYWPAVMHGEIWRVLTFVFVPGSMGVFMLAITLYCNYLIGHGLESTWGDFRFNVYYLCGMVGAVISAALFGIGTGTYLNLSLFFAFAMLYPDMQFLFFFLIPVKAKYLGMISGGICLLQFVFGPWYVKGSIFFSLINFLLFFGSDFFNMARQEIRYAKNRRNWRNNWR